MKTIRILVANSTVKETEQEERGRAPFLTGELINSVAGLETLKALQADEGAFKHKQLKVRKAGLPPLFFLLILLDPGAGLGILALRGANLCR
jgi:hypothetical protein